MERGLAEGQHGDRGAKGEKSVDEGQYAEVSAAGWAGLWSAVRPAEAPHPVDRGELGEYAVLLRRDARAAARAYPAVAAHLATSCVRCADDLEELVAFVDEERRASAPRAAVAGGLAQVLATLTSPSSGPAAAALRGGPGAAPLPPMATYQTADVTVTVRLGPGAVPGTASLKGLVVHRHSGPAALSGGRAKLLPLGQAGALGATYEAGVDDLGNFVLHDVASGAYRLELYLVDQVVVVDELQTGHDHDQSTA
ncbi:MAG: hypothetical protein M3442_12285 [Chloroflexota bacterium]|nr:hypothetical protein [Chloroflexota bacterium]